jgi:hypothetical protein
MHTARLVLVLFGVLVAAVPAFAHAMKTVVTVTETEIQVRVSFDGDDDLRGTVTVRLEEAETKAVLGKAEPDKTGLCSFPRPKPGQYRIVADDGFGHHSERPFDVTDGSETTVSQDADRPRGAMIAIGLGAIGVLTLVGYWFTSRKKG